MCSPRQPGAQVLPVGRGDLAPLHLPGHGVEIVESQLLPVNIQPAYDRHPDLLQFRDALPGARTRNGFLTNHDAGELRGSSLRTATAPARHPRPASRCMSSNGEIVVVDSDAAVGATRPALEIAAIAQVGKIAGDATQIRCYLPPRRPLAGRGGR